MKPYTLQVLISKLVVWAKPGEPMPGPNDQHLDVYSLFDTAIVDFLKVEAVHVMRRSLRVFQVGVSGTLGCLHIYEPAPARPKLSLDDEQCPELVLWD